MVGIAYHISLLLDWQVGWWQQVGWWPSRNIFVMEWIAWRLLNASDFSKVTNLNQTSIDSDLKSDIIMHFTHLPSSWNLREMGPWDLNNKEPDYEAYDFNTHGNSPTGSELLVSISPAIECHWPRPKSPNHWIVSEYKSLPYWCFQE